METINFTTPEILVLISQVLIMVSAIIMLVIRELGEEKPVVILLTILLWMSIVTQTFCYFIERGTIVISVLTGTILLFSTIFLVMFAIITLVELVKNDENGAFALKVCMVGVIICESIGILTMYC